MSNRWSYQVIQVKPGTWGGFKTESMQAELNRLGAQGWELVSIAMPHVFSPAMLVFKREQ